MTVALQAPQWYCSDMVASEHYFWAEPIWKLVQMQRIFSFHLHHITGQRKSRLKRRKWGAPDELLKWSIGWHMGHVIMVLTYRGLLAIRGAPIDWDHPLDAGDGDEDNSVVLLRQYFECQRIGSQTDKKRLMWNPQMWLWLLGSNVWGQYLGLCVCLHVINLLLKLSWVRISIYLKSIQLIHWKGEEN